MAKTHWLFVFATFVVSCISLALLIVSISTTEWLKSEAFNTIASQNSEVTYGLFSGSLTRYLVSTPQKFDLTVTCSYGDGICFYSCHDTSENRQKDLENLKKNGISQSCSPKSKNIMFGTKQSTDNTAIKANEQLIGSGYWVCTVMFLIIAIIFSSTSAIFSLINVTLNPIEPIFSIFGLYIWNGILAVSCLLTLIIWGSLFDISLNENIAIADTLTLIETYYSKGLAKLGYSYFILIIPLIFSFINIGLLLMRNHLLKKESEPAVITMDDKYDTAISFY